MVLIIGTPKRVPLILRKPYLTILGSLWLKENSLIAVVCLPAGGFERDHGRKGLGLRGALSGSGLRVQGSGLGIWCGMWFVDCGYRVQFSISFPALT